MAAVASFRRARCRGEACFALLRTSAYCRLGAGRTDIVVWVRYVRILSFGRGTSEYIRWGVGSYGYCRIGGVRMDVEALNELMQYTAWVLVTDREARRHRG
jgi:hypothetical protein